MNSMDLQISGDYSLLYRAFYNLIENAVNYNLPGGSVKIEVCLHKKEKGFAAVTVKDTGIGIPDSLKKQVFEPFYRVDKSKSREMGGAGLGLSLVDTIIKKHGGKIQVLDNEKKGSCFIVMLPI